MNPGHRVFIATLKYDKNGLTIMTGAKAPLVDNSRWNSSDGTYTPTNGTPMSVKIIKNPQGQIVAVKQVFGMNIELYANGIFWENALTVTSSFCDQLDAQKIELEAKKCQNFLGDFFKLYEGQASEAVVNTFQDIAKLDGVPPVANNVDTMTTMLKGQSNNIKYIENMSIIVRIGYVAQKCSDLKRYTTDESSATTKAPLKNKQKVIRK